MGQPSCRESLSFFTRQNFQGTAAMTKPSLLDPGEVLPLLGPDSVLEQPRLLSIGQICEETGLTADVIRVWERRYGFPVPVRRPSGHRRYQFEDLARLKQ